jgi:hypothetical protein
VVRLLTAVLVLVPWMALAYPIPPQTIWDVVADSELIVSAVVKDVRTTKTLSIARLEVEETWKGTAPAKLEVRFDPDMQCPLPPQYLKGRRVVAFLGRSNKGNWMTVSLSYGTRYPADDAERAEMKASVEEAIALQTSGDAKGIQLWAVSSFAKRSVRWDALQVLGRDTDAAREVFRKGAMPGPLPPELLAELERAFIARPSWGPELVSEMRALRAQKSKVLDEACADIIETVLVNETARYWSDQAIDLLSERLGQEVIESRGPDRLSDDTIQLKWDTLKKRLGLKPKLRADYERSRELP